MAKEDTKQGIEDLKNELTKMADLFEHTKINYQVLDRKGIIYFVNSPWLKSLGYKKEEVLGKSFIDFLLGDSVKAFHANFNNCLKLHPKEEVELDLRCSDGSIMNASFSCFCNREGNENALKIHCTFQNITRLRTVEEALKASEDKYERIFNSFLDVYYQTGIDRTIKLISPSVYSVGGYHPGEVTGSPVDDFFCDPEEQLKFREILFEKGHVEDYDLKLKKKDGVFLDVSLSAQLIRDQKGDVQLIEGVIRDISRRREVENALASHMDQIIKITDSLPIVLFQLRMGKNKTELEYISPNVKERLGLDPEELIRDPQSLLKLVSTDDRLRIGKELAGAMKENRCTEIEYEVKHLHDRSGWSRIRLTPTATENQEVVWTGISTDITAEVLLRKQFEEREAQLNVLFDSVNLAVASMSLKGVVSSINPAVTRITGYETHEIEGKHFKDIHLFYPRDLSRYLNLFKNALLGKLPDEALTFPWKHKDGKQRWTEAYLNILRDKGKIIGFQGVFLDITDRVLLQKAEASRQKDFEFLFNSAIEIQKIETEPALYQFLANQLEIIEPGVILNLNSVNEENSLLRVESVRGMSGRVRTIVQKLLNYQLNGRTFSINRDSFSYARHGKLMRIHDNMYDLCMQQIPKKLCSQIEKTIGLREILEISIGVDDKIMGGCAMFLCEGQHIRKPHLIESLFRQATETLIRLRANHYLAQREELYRSLAENAQDLIIRLNQSMEVIYVNQAFLDAFKLQSGQATGKALIDLGLSASIDELIHKTAKRTITSGKPQECDNVITLDGITRFFEWRMFPEFDKQKKLQSVLMFVRDISERKSIEARMQESIENKNKIYSLIGHDLKSPFNSLLGFLDLLKYRYNELSDELRLKYIDYISESSRNLFDLLTSLQEWSKGLEHEENFNPVFFELLPLINASLSVSQIQVLDKKLVIKNQIPPGILIKADYNMIFASFRNIISNACKFSNPGGEILLTLKKVKTEIRIEIRDQGIGMTQAEITKLLGQDTVFTKPGTSGEKGSGLGFKLTREFIEKNGGWIKVASLPDKGCTVTIGLKTK